MFQLYENESFALTSRRARITILQKLTLVEIQECEPVLSPGQFQEHLYFIKSGVVRCYYKAFEDECTNWFASEGNAIFSTESFLNHAPSPEYIETCTPVTLYRISKKDYHKLLKDFPELYQLAFDFLRRYLLKAEQRMHDLHMLNALQRYEQFIEEHRQIANRVQMKHIASYLGITPTHFSRIRKQLTNNRLITDQKLKESTYVEK